MSVEFDHYPPSHPGVHVSVEALAGHRQRLYDAKLALSSEHDVHRAMALINQALDDTVDWEER